MSKPPEHSTDSQLSQVTLYCPHCDYNLTGLPENRCPECGRAFDPQELLAEAAENPRPIPLKTALIRLLWPPITCAMSALIGIRAIFGLASFLLLLCAMPNAFMIAERIVAGQVTKRNMGFSRTRDWKRIVFLWLALYVLQLAIMAALTSAMNRVLRVPLTQFAP